MIVALSEYSHDGAQVFGEDVPCLVPRWFIVAVLLSLCVGRFIRGICFVIICSSSLFLSVSREGYAT